MFQCVGVVLNLSQFDCTVQTSALTTSIVGNVKAVAQTVVGYVVGVFVLGDTHFNLFNIGGLTLNLAGAIGYTYFKTSHQHCSRNSPSPVTDLSPLRR